LDSLFVSFGLSGFKPMLAALALPPVPLLLLVLFAGRLLASNRRAAGRVLLFVSVAGLWLSCCAGVGSALERWMLRPPAPLSETRIALLRQASATRKPVVLILSGGREALAPEYREAHLSARSLQRLHYGLWLARQVNAPVMYTGGTGLSQLPGPAEADIAARIAERDYGRRLRWVETGSRDTRENAAASLSLLASEGITEVIVVTHGWHMPRAMRAFQDAVKRNKLTMQISAAPMGLAPVVDRPALNWVPTIEGFSQVRITLREALGLLFGA
jgi:uncharacterized SAM-binding protein YcdF (DUF218 family)